MDKLVDSLLPKFKRFARAAGTQLEEPQLNRLFKDNVTVLHLKDAKSELFSGFFDPQEASKMCREEDQEVKRNYEALLGFFVKPKVAAPSVSERFKINSSM